MAHPVRLMRLAVAAVAPSSAAAQDTPNPDQAQRTAVAQHASLRGPRATKRTRTSERVDHNQAEIAANRRAMV
jgi:hypothetical protein